MTTQEFIDAMDNYELEAEFAQFQYDNYPDHVTVDDFADHMIDE